MQRQMLGLHPGGVVTPNFEALGLIAEVALGIVGFSAVLIGLNRSTDRFSEPDQFRVQLLSFSGFGALFAALLPFAAFDIHDSTLSWQIVTAALLIYASAGLTIFPQRMLKLRAAGYADLFPTHIFAFQTGILVLVFIFSLLMIIGAIEALATCYTACLLLYLLQSSVAFFRTMFVRVRP
jgi:hypothetical protein